MQGNNFDIIFLIAVSAYLAIKLFSILGRKNEQDSNIEAKTPASAPMPVLKDIRKPNTVANNNTQQQPVFKNNLDDFKFTDDVAKNGMKLVLENDKNFNIGMFLEGAKIAFEMVLKAFSQNDKGTLKELLSDEIYNNFSNMIDENIRNNIKVSKSLVGIDSAEFNEVSLNGSNIVIKLRFITEQINTVIDANGNVIEGDSKNIETVEDFWQFEHNIKSSNPNWVITSL
jgi:predicted lipid-binding transport protein (Tim44 family)